MRDLTRDSFTPVHNDDGGVSARRWMPPLPWHGRDRRDEKSFGRPTETARPEIETSSVVVVVVALLRAHYRTR